MALATLNGLLGPVFMLATGALVQAVKDGADVTAPLITVGLLFVVMRSVDPIRGELGTLLWPRVDEWVARRVMLATTRPPGLKEIESPEVQDRIAQARGIFWGFTPGQAAAHLGDLWQFRMNSLASLAIVAWWYWWAALLLASVYVACWLVERNHYLDVTEVMWGRSEAMRRAFYIRTLGLSSRIAKETRIFDLARWLTDQYRARSLAVLNEVWHKREEGWVRATLMFATIALLELLVLRAIVLDAMSGRIALGTAVAVAQAVLSAGLLSRYEDDDSELTEAQRALDKVAELEASTAAAVDTVGRRPADGMPRGSVRFEDVSFTYPGRATPVLHHFNLNIEVGRSLAIVGENGAGKTTIVKLLTRLLEPTDGKITVDGVDLCELDPTSWHGRVSALFQDYARFEMTAYDNVAFGALHAYDNATAVERAAEQAGVKRAIDRLPTGWQTTLSREFRAGAELSGGEWQRLALARGLFGVAAGAGILILDEPTASMDVRGEAEIYQQFIELTRGVTTIVISHRFSTVRRADRIVVVEHGRAIEDGSHAELLAKPGSRYAQMYQLQASRFEPLELENA